METGNSDGADYQSGLGALLRIVVAAHVEQVRAGGEHALDTTGAEQAYDGALLNDGFMAL